MITAKKVRKKVLMRAGTLLVLAFLFVLDAPVPSAFIKGMPKGSRTTFVWSALPVLLTPIMMVMDQERIARSLAAQRSWGKGQTAPSRNATYLLYLLLPKEILLHRFVCQTGTGAHLNGFSADARHHRHRSPASLV